MLKFATKWPLAPAGVSAANFIAIRATILSEGIEMSVGYMRQLIDTALEVRRYWAVVSECS